MIDGGFYVEMFSRKSYTAMTGCMTCRRVTKLGAFVLVLLALVGTLMRYHITNHRDLNHVQKGPVLSPSLSSSTSLSSSELSTPSRESNALAPSSHESSRSTSSYKPLLATSSESSLPPSPSSNSSSSSAPFSKNSLSLTLTSNDTSTSSPHYLILIIVMSTCSKSGSIARDTIRKTWAQDCRNKVPPILVKFAIGTLGLLSSQMDNLTVENEAHGDLLLLTNLHDAYSNITRKVLYSFVWADQYVKFSYLLKADDDTFIYVNDLHREAYRYYQDGVNRLYWGRYNWKTYPITTPNHKWAEHNWFLCDHYFPYAYGSAYIISADLIHNIAITADYLQLYNSEDVSVGVWLSLYKIQRKDDGHFHHFQYSRNYHKCPGRSCWTITTTPQNMYKLYSQL